LLQAETRTKKNEQKVQKARFHLAKKKNRLII
jgi:hypothetical protein